MPLTGLKTEFMLERISSSSVFGAFSIFLMWGDTEKQREFVIIFIKIYLIYLNSP